jgi:hypothetical protein
MPEIFKTEQPARMLRAVLFVACATLSLAMMATACNTSSARPNSSIEVAFTYQGTRSNLVGSSQLWMQGGAAHIHGQFYGGWAQWPKLKNGE